MATTTSRTLIFAAATAAALAGIGGYAAVESRRPAVLELFVFDVPGNPAVFIRTPNDRRILINGGANSDIIRHITDILPFYSRRIDAVIATDDDPKNVTGLIDVLNRYSVDTVVLPAITLQSLGLASSTDPIYQTFLTTIEAHKVPVREVSAGQRLMFDQPLSQSTNYGTYSPHSNSNESDRNDPVIADILFPVDVDQPPPSSAPFQYSKASAPGIIMRISYGTTSIVFMGDSSLKIQKFVASNNDLPADVLITSNSVAPSSLAFQLVDSFAPDYLVYSQQLTKQGSARSQEVVKSAGVSDQKPKADPLAGILDDHRFNVEEKGMVKIVSDGNALKVTTK